MVFPTAIVSSQSVGMFPRGWKPEPPRATRCTFWVTLQRVAEPGRMDPGCQVPAPIVRPTPCYAVRTLRQGTLGAATEEEILAAIVVIVEPTDSAHTTKCGGQAHRGGEVRDGPIAAVFEERC